MSKKSFIIGGIILTLSLISLPAFALDYSSMETSELSALRGTMGNATSQEREAFRLEWQKRVSEMNSGEANQYRTRANKRNGDGNGKAYRHHGSKQVVGGQQNRNRTGTCTATGNTNTNTNRGGNYNGNGNRR